MLKFFKRPIVIFFLVVIVLIGWGILRANNDKKPQYEYIEAKRADLFQEVSVTGKIAPAANVDLAFERSGKVAAVLAKVGDSAADGQVLVQLHKEELDAQLAQARAAVLQAEGQREQYQAALNRERARLADLRRGALPEDIQVAQTNLNNAQTALANAQRNLQAAQDKAQTDLANIYSGAPTSANDAYIKADDAVRKQTADFFTTAEYSSIYTELTFQIADSQLRNDIGVVRANALQSVTDWRTLLNRTNSGSSTEDLDRLIDTSLGFLTNIQNYLNLCMNAADRSLGLASATVTSYKANVTTARTNLSASAAALNTLKQSISAQRQTNSNLILAAQIRVDDAQSSAASAASQLGLKQADTPRDQIRAQEAQVKQARAALSSQGAAIAQARASEENLLAQIAKTTLVSPISGVVSRQDAKTGQTVSANAPVISVISNNRFNVEANITETDIAKVRIGQDAEVTLDAYGIDVIFPAKVAAIDPAAVFIEGVAVYKTTFAFAADDDRFRAGFTANVDIAADSRKNVIVVPQNSVFRENGGKFVRALKGETVEKIAVETGLKGSDGNIEIISGIAEGDKILAFGGR